MNCKNCGTPVQGNYCSHCGQKTSVGKITASSLMKELSTSLFQVNNGFFYTLINLFKQPGSSIRAYLDGQRKRHFKPITYVLTLSTLYFLVSTLSGQNTWMDDLVTGFATGAYDAGNPADIPPILIWFAQNFAYTTLSLLPIFSLASYLAFMRFQTSYLEHFVLNAYVTGQQAIFYTLLALVKQWVDLGILELLTLIITSGYAFWVFWQFFDQGSRWSNILRSLWTYVLYLLFSLMALLLLMGLATLF